MNTHIDLSLIDPGPNDRTVFNPDKLNELATSIREHGLIEPIVVRPIGRRFEIIAGERRFRACKMAGLTEAPCIVRHETNERASILMLAENVARDDLDPIDEAMAYQKRMDEYGWTVETCAAYAGVSIQRIQGRVKLLRLRADLRDLVRKGDLKLGYAQILADANLDTNRQLMAIARLRDNPTPTPAWFRRETGKLFEQQAQTSLLDETPLLTGNFETAMPPTAPRYPELPTPSTATAPKSGKTLREQVASQLAFWTSAGAAWEELGKTRQAAECKAAAATLQTVLDLVAVKSQRRPPTPSAPVPGYSDWRTYQAALAAYRGATQ